MKTIAKYFKPLLPLILVALCLLGFQAWCDLSLPTYTSKIVDVGIAAGGIVEDFPEMIPASEYETLFEADSAIISDSYKPLDESAEDYKALSKKYPNTEGTYYLAQPSDGLSELMSSVYAQSGRNSGKYASVMTSYIIDCYEQLGLNPTTIQIKYITGVGLQMLGLVLLSVASAIGLSYLSANIGATVSRNLRRDVYTKTLSFSPSEFDKFSTASLITRSTNDIQQIQMMSIMALRMIAYAPMLAIGGVFKVLTTSPSMWWIIGLAVAIIVVLLLGLMLVTMPKFKLQQKLVDRLNLVSREVLTGLPVIRAFGTEKREKARFGEANSDLMKTGRFVNRTMGLMMPTMNLVMNGTTLLIVWIGASQIGAGVLQVGDMMAFITYSMQIIMSFLMLGMISIMLPRAMVSVERVAEVLNADTSIKDPELPSSFDTAQVGTVEFRDVSFKYPGASENVLSNISFKAMPGETTAIIGATGCGKSTLVNLIPRFFDVSEGSVLVNGVDVRDVSQKTLRDEIGLVPQKSVLFSGTIGSNISFSDEDMAMDNIENAAEISQAMEFISGKEHKFDDPIAQGGTNVSGGQKQRLAIARAIAKNAPVYIFDDSFSALDYATDRRLRTALAKTTENSAVIIVTQRISTVLTADKIIVMDEGRIAGMGTHRELMETCPEYQEIALSQLSKEELGNG